jgi:hypothetical protein
MKITMSDGREFALTKIARRIHTEIGEYDLPTNIGTVWCAEYVTPVHKMHSTFARRTRGFGSSFNTALAAVYEKLDDAGELDDDMLPCEDCGKGYRVLSVVDSYVQHDDKCPAMNDTGET